MHTKSSLNPSSGSFVYGQSMGSTLTDDKENLGYFRTTTPADLGSKYRVDPLGPQGSFLTVGTAVSRDGSLPPSRASNSDTHGMYAANPYMSRSHTPSSSVPSHRPSFSGLSNPYAVQNGAMFDDMTSHEELSKRLSGISLGEVERVNHYSTATRPSHTGDGPSYQRGGPVGPWSESMNERDYSQFDAYTTADHADHGYYDKTHPYDGRQGIGRRLDFDSNFHSAGEARLAGPEGGLRGRGSVISGEVERRAQALYAQQQALLYHGQYANYSPYALAPEYLQAPPLRPGFPHGYSGLGPAPFSAPHMAPNRPARENDSGAGIRSAILEEVRNNSKSSRKYELKVIYGHVVEFSGDQHGSRFLQSKLETANSEEKEQLFREILPNARQLMTDVFGNYVIQKVFEHGSQVQKKVLGDAMKNHMLELSINLYGCRVVQKVCRGQLNQATTNKNRHWSISSLISRPSW